MNKTKLMEAVHSMLYSDWGYSKADIVRIIDGFLDLIEGSILKGEKVLISGLVSFKARTIKAKTYRIPGTDKTIDKPKRSIYRAYISKTLAGKTEKAISSGSGRKSKSKK
ncbi:MAG: HU family DNA-binding protein [Trichodesmium sp. MAG_R01]|nr:HU family DNA-binding protein [Trichodesmium sp. MAG_R01]